ncbi:hypothetical protein M569_09230 [Genlisea aurea]|uniref:non-specific serine/threonine protein kinase n=1 Tax=Genlisea aurea TaxID=192259 RepID=S8DZS4_9LAMI|nr:hypothetical protein M569_09230 [Genlisea aurea]
MVDDFMFPISWISSSSSSTVFVRTVVLLLTFFFFIGSTGGGGGAEGGEVVGSLLLAFKESCIEADPAGFLADWASSSAPCSWTGVSCSGDGSVTELNFTGAGLVGRLSFEHLARITHLRNLLFSGNFFAGDLLLPPPPYSPCNFEILDFSGNMLTAPLAGDSPTTSCPRISHLNLSTNRIRDLSFLDSLLSDCRNLRSLNLSNNNSSGNLGNSLLRCEALSVLDLSKNHLSGEIPLRFLTNSVNSLRILDISSNAFGGNLEGFDFRECTELAALNLSDNGFSGFPAGLTSCRKLETLDVSRNGIQLRIPGEILGRIGRLRRLNMAHNSFSGGVPAELAGICRTLEEIDLSFNNLSGELPPNFTSCSPSLSILKLGNNELSGDFLDTVVSSLTGLRSLSVPFNNISGRVPPSLARLTLLRELDLSSNNLTGSVPHELCNSTDGSNSTLEKLLLADNYLSGSVPPELGNCKNLKSIDLSFNNLKGSIPDEIWSLPEISDIVMWANELDGEIPAGICGDGGGGRNLQTLILNNNLIGGSIPASIVNCTNLIWVSFSGNKIAGEIPADIGTLVNLAIFQAGNNSLSGGIPASIGRCKNLIWLDLNSNELTGEIPPELASQSGYIVPGAVSGKEFAFVRNEGGEECRGAGGLFEFRGIRAGRLDDFPMVHSCPLTRIYSGVTVYTFSGNGSMIYLDLSYNSFVGTIPENFGSMGFLQVLNLGHNNISGEIPASFGGLRNAGVLDLSYNRLNGTIPGSLGGLSLLTAFDASNNELTGQIPVGGQLTTFPAARYANNSGLCGLPLPACVAGNPSCSGNSAGRIKRGNFAGLVMAIGVMASVASIFLLIYLRLIRRRKMRGEEKKEEEKYLESLPETSRGSSNLKFSGEPLSINIATFEIPLRKLTFAQLLEATNGFSSLSLIGSGGFGDVYRAELGDGAVVAVKKLNNITCDREFTAEMETIGKIKHRNLVPLLGYCTVGDERLLVYEYMKFGSLESILHGGGGERLNWEIRKKIAVGTARGLAFLHHSCIPRIIHRDMKSSNVLIDEGFEPRVSDFGMARLVNALDTHLTTTTLTGTPGYVPPEYYHSFRCTAKGDVYSYGVVLLEILSGKKPIDTASFGEDSNLVEWAKKLHKEMRSREIVDSDLKSGDGEIYRFLKIALDCVEDRPHRRPTMVQILASFNELHND